MLEDSFRNLKLFEQVTRKSAAAKSEHSLGGISPARSSPSDYLGFFSRWRLRKRTPGPPPFSSMNSMPARSSALRIA